MSREDYSVCVDDDPVIFRILERSIGMTVLPFATSEGLRNQAHKLRPMGAFVDIHLSEVDCGIDLIPFLRDFWPCIPLLVMTSGHSWENAAAQGWCSGR